MMKRMVLCMLAGLLFSGLAQAALTSTMDDQKSVEVTVYNSNIGLVKDTRRLQLPEGQGELSFMDVASSIMPYTVHVQGQDLRILEQNYEYDLMDSAKLLDKYVGKSVKLVNRHEYQDREDVTDAVLLSNNNGQIYKIGDEIHLGAPGFVVLPQLPQNLVSKPTLTWIFDNASSSGEQNVQVSYLTENINWKADYVLSVNADDTKGDLSGWVTLDNNSGAIYKNAKLKLVAGKVNRVAASYDLGMMVAKRAAMSEMAAPMMQEHGFFEYHMYDLPYKTTIKDKQTKQLALLQGSGIKLSKEFVIDAGVFENYFWYHNSESGKIKMPVAVKIKFRNSKENHLGMPLPEGTVRIYKQDLDKSLEFAGEDNIGHTPKDEDVSLKVGEAFDVVAESRQTDFKQIDSWTFESEWEITIRNHKDADIQVAVVEPVSFGLSNFNILSSTYPYHQLNTSTVRFDVPVAKDKESVLTFRVRVKRG